MKARSKLSSFLSASLLGLSPPWAAAWTTTTRLSATSPLKMISSSSRGTGIGAKPLMSSARSDVVADQGQKEYALTAELLDSLEAVPKLIVLDLDNTLWTPELYQIRQRQVPSVQTGQIRLFEAAQQLLEFFAQNKSIHKKVQLAVASRTSKTDWAHQLLDDFTVTDDKGLKVPIRSLFSIVEIQKGSKRQHFERIRQQSAGVAYSEMLFVDDDARMNLGEISQMGVLCCHTPRGLTLEHLVKSLQKYSELKAGHDASHWMGYILNSDNLNIAMPQAATGGAPLQGRVKFYSPPKRFGFVIDAKSGQEFFVHESKVPAGVQLQAGDRVVFESLTAGGSGRASAVILSAKGGNNSNQNSNQAAAAPAEEMVEMPCFSMSQPFASLLLNGVKTVESRNQPMFEEIQPGTRVLVACGRRDWHDQESYQQILRDNGGMSESEMTRASRLPRNFRKGQVVGVVTVGATRLTTPSERRTSRQLQRQVLAYEEGLGRYCTDIPKAQWLRRAVSARGQPGIYTVSVPKSCLPPS